MSQRHCLRPKHFAKVQGPTPAEGVAPVKSDPSTSAKCKDKLSAHMKYRTTAHLVYNLNFPIVFVTKYRNKVLTGKERRSSKRRSTTVKCLAFDDICANYGWEVMALEVMPDHVHLFVSFPPKVACTTVGRTLKSILAVAIFRQFPGLKKRRFWGSGLWTRGTYYGSAGAVSGSTIMRYIEQQKEA